MPNRTEKLLARAGKNEREAEMSNPLPDFVGDTQAVTQSEPTPAECPLREKATDAVGYWRCTERIIIGWCMDEVLSECTVRKAFQSWHEARCLECKELPSEKLLVASITSSMEGMGYKGVDLAAHNIASNIRATLQEEACHE